MIIEDHSSMDQVKSNELKELKIINKMGTPDISTDAEKDTEWYFWQGTIYMKPINFQIYIGLYVISLKKQTLMQT
ncbi:hypothetical protein F5X99DRAFT_368799 [Biscogniauxia marginata]|nr:hypothetical protein F5X99DRAFT_368799 [Biscogniauxia marginata]